MFVVSNITNGREIATRWQALFIMPAIFPSYGGFCTPAECY